MPESVSENTEITLYPYGDHELWVASGKEDDWTLPLIIDWMFDKENNHHYASVWPPFCPYVSQSLKLNSLLGFHNLHERRDKWLIRKEMVEVLLTKAPGITPSKYYKWPEDDTPMRPMERETQKIKQFGIKDNANRLGDGSYESFIKHVASEYKIQNSLIRLVMRAVMAEAPRWMVEHRQPLNLGFCKLVAVPFRPNWKEVVGAKFRKFKLLGIFNLPNPDRRKALEEIGMPEALCSPQNIALRKNGSRDYRFTYCLEAIPTRAFERIVDDVEAKRIACGNVSRVSSYEKTVEKLYDHIIDALEANIRKVFLPFATIRKSPGLGWIRFAPCVRKWERLVNGKDVRNLPIRIVEPASNFSVQAEKGSEAVVCAKTPKMQKMSFILPKPNDLRKSIKSGDMGQPWEERDNGVPMRDAVKVIDTREPVLPVSKAGESV